MKIFNILTEKATKNSPEIAIALGLAGTVVATVLACKATIKAKEILNEYDDNKETVEKCMKETEDEQYNEKDYKKDLLTIRIQTLSKLAKTYAIPAALEAASILAILKGHKILKGRYLALGATAELLRKHNNSIREEIERRYGKDVRDEIVKGIKTEVVSVADENGATTREKETLKYIDRNDINSPYIHFFDAASRDFVDDREHNLAYLSLVERHATDMFRASSNGKITMNRVLEMLDLPFTSAGYVLGWDLNDPECDDFIDFGITEELIKDGDRLEPVIMLNFNCNGRIVNS